MKKTKLIPLLEQFHIPLPDKIDSYNLIGLDYGDGEISVMIVQWDMIKGGYSIKVLPLNEAATLWKNPNAYYISPTYRTLVVDVRESELTRNDGGVRYYNFKKCPGTEEAKNKFRLDDGQTRELTYEEVMAEGFNIAVNRVFQCETGGLIDRNKPTVILVGCPSSEGWENGKKEYARLLQSRLKLPDSVTAPVYVAIHKESNAALARELDPKWGEKRIKRSEVIVILDNGSSTFDITVVGTHGIPEGGEDSFQFGGNLLDENLLKLLWKELREQYGNREPVSYHGHKLGLRIAKENYYGMDGQLQLTAPYTITLRGEADKNGKKPRLTFFVDDRVMDQAINQIPVTAYHFEKAMGSMILKKPVSCDSWLEGCRTVYQSFYDEMKKFFVLKGNDPAHPVIPHRIIMSGGVSVMPEVRQLVKEVFGVEPVLTDHPNYCVSEGLAYVLISEVRKGQYLRDVMKQVREKLPGAVSLKESVIRAGVHEDWETFKQSMKKWADKEELLSVKDWYMDYYKKEFNENLNLPVLQGAKAWFQEQNVEEIITGLLREKFNAIFPGYADDFRFDMPAIDFSALKGVCVTIESAAALVFGQMTANECSNAVFSMESYEKKRSKAWRSEGYENLLHLEQTIRGGGSLNVTYTYTKKGLLGTKQKTGVKTVSYKGLDQMYRDGLTDRVTEGIRNDVLALLEEPLKEYVETITPYFNMTART